MKVEYLNFNYNVSLKTINCLNAIDFTYHINNFDYNILHTHCDYYEFTIVLDGSIKNYNNNEIININKDILFISSKNDTHYFVNNSKNKSNLKILNIIAREEAINKILDDLFKPFKDYFINNKIIIKLPNYLLDMINYNINLVNSYSETNWQKTNMILRGIIIDIINYLYLNYIENTKDIPKWEAILNALKIDQNFYKYNVNELSERLGYSRAQLNRIFYERFNMSPHEYLVEEKLNYSSSLLKYTNYSISEISKLVGYSQINSFNEKFKNKYKLTPLKYRQKYKKS